MITYQNTDFESIDLQAIERDASINSMTSTFVPSEDLILAVARKES